MNEDDAQCQDLTQKTADALDSNVLGELFAVVQQNNVNVSIKAALRMWVNDLRNLCGGSHARICRMINRRKDLNQDLGEGKKTGIAKVFMLRILPWVSTTMLAKIL